MQIRRDARINWIVNPVHKRREARGLTSIGKQVRVTPVGMLDIFSSLFQLFRTVVLEKVIASTTLLLAPPGKSTTLCPCPDTVDRFQLSFVFTITCHTMLYSPMPCMPTTLQSHELLQGSMCKPRLEQYLSNCSHFILLQLASSLCKT